MTVALTSILGVLGLAIGSFLNVVIYRVPAGMSIVRPASACPSCGAEIRARDNVPVIGWVLLRGRCRDCSSAISARYPIIEALTGLAFVAITLWYLPHVLTATTVATAVAGVLELVAYLYFAAITIALALIDIDVKRLPDPIVLPSIVVGGVLLVAAGILRGDGDSLLRLLIGGAAAFVFFFIIAFAVPGGMGFGDVKLAAVLGIYLGYSGWGPLIVGIMAAFLIGGVVGIVLMLARRAGRKTAIPFGPWLLVGAWVGIVVGDRLAETYLVLSGIA